MALVLLAAAGQAFDAPPKDQGHSGTLSGRPPAPPDENPQQCRVADPVNINTGEFTLPVVDVFTSGGYIPLVLERFYAHSNRAQEGPFGLGWTHNYDMQLVKFTEGAQQLVVINIGDGAQLRFVSDGAGGFTPPAGRHFTLSGSGSTYTLTRADGFAYEFSAGRLEALRNTTGQSTQLGYDVAGRLLTVTGPTGRQLRFAYGANNKVANVTDPSGNSVTYTYNQIGQLLSVSSPLGNTTRYAYGASNELTAITDGKNVEVVRNTYDTDGRVNRQFFRGGTFSFSYFTGYTRVCNRRGWCTNYYYNEFGNPTRVDRPGSNDTTHEWDAAFNLATLTDGSGGTTTWSHDGRGNPTTVLDALGNQSSMSWDPTFNRLTAITDPNGNMTQFTYNSAGTLTQITDARGQNVMTVTQTDSAGQPTQLRDANGGDVQLAYDTHGQIIRIRRGGSDTRFVYDTAGRIVRLTQSDGVEQRFIYDADGRLLRIQDSLGNRRRFAHDRVGNLLTMDIADATGQVEASTTTTWDEWDRPVGLTTSGNQTTAIVWDANDNVSTVTNPLGATSRTTYDGLDRPSAVRYPNGRSTNISYDGTGRVTNVALSDGTSYQFEYDAIGNETAFQNINVGRTERTFDAAGNLTTQTSATGAVTTYAYDALNRVTAETFADTTQNKTYFYDDDTNGNLGRGRLTGFSDPTGATNLRYDVRGRLIDETHTDAGRSTAIRYGYSNADRLTEITYPSGRRIEYTYNTQGQIEAVRSVLNSITTPLATGVEYVPFGPARAFTYGNGIGHQRSFDQDLRLTQMVSATVSRLTYSYDAANRLLAIENQDAPQNDESYEYDTLDRLVSASGDYGELTYTYDDSDNRTSLTLGTSTDTHSLAPGTHQLASADERAFTYSADGRVATDGDRTLTYSDDGRLLGVSASGVSAEYTYDAVGRRRSKTVNGTTTYYHYDQTGQLIAETDASGNTQREYVYLYGVLLAIFEGNAVRYVHTDHRGAPTAMTNAQGNVVWRASIRPFGEAAVTSASSTLNVRLPGQYYDAETGYHYNYSRYFDPRLGRYLQPDPSGIDGGLNLYAYTENNPISYYDAGGEAPLPLATGAIGALAGAVGNIVGQGITNFRTGRSLTCINWKNVGVAAGTGFAAGAAAPFVATTYLGAAALGGTANVVQYGATQTVNGDEISLEDAGVSFATGAVAGGIAGPISPSKGLRFAETPRYWGHKPIAHARALNQAAAIRANITAGNIGRNVLGGVTSNVDPSATPTSCGCK